MAKRAQSSKAASSSSKPAMGSFRQSSPKMSKMVRTTTKGVVTRYHKAIKKLERY